MPFLTAIPELGSSRVPGKQHIVRIRNGERSVVATANLSKRQAEELADRLNDLFTDRPQLFSPCASCGAALLSRPLAGHASTAHRHAHKLPTGTGEQRCRSLSGGLAASWAT